MMREIAAIKNLNSMALHSAARLHELSRSLWKVLTFSAADERIAPKKDLCIAIEKSGLSVAYGTRCMSRISIRGARNYRPEGPGYPQPKDVASSAVLAVKEFGAAGAGITLSIPKAWAIIKIAEFPPTVRENLPDVVAYELDRLMPFSPEEALYDFKALTEGTERVAIAVVAAKADLVNTYIEALRDEGIPVSRLTVNLSGIGALCRFMGKGGKALFVEVREDGYEGALYFDGVLAGAFNRIFTAVDERAKAEEIETEIRTLLATAQEQDPSPHVIALMRNRSAALKEMLQGRINQPVTFLGETYTKLRVPGNQKGIPYAAVGGVVESLWPKARGLDLLKKGRHRSPGTPKVLTAALVLSVLVLWGVYLVAPLKVEEEKLGDIERQIKLRKSGIREVEALRKEVDAIGGAVASIDDFKEKGPMSVTILKELTTILPKSAWLTRVRITGSTVEIEGYASSATELLPRLEASKVFRKAEFTSPTFRDARMNSDRFNIKMEIKRSKEHKGAPLKDAEK
ncbi:MAG: PilN domain-containing protein [Nitrospirae bacterium]|nr:PilN domain-containing protein [Nitrospirota bacterium]